jgi:hypothetical protein
MDISVLISRFEEEEEEEEEEDKCLPNNTAAPSVIAAGHVTIAALPCQMASLMN